MVTIDYCIRTDFAWSDKKKRVLGSLGIIVRQMILQLFYPFLVPRIPRTVPIIYASAWPQIARKVTKQERATCIEIPVIARYNIQTRQVCLVNVYPPYFCIRRTIENIEDPRLTAEQQYQSVSTIGSVVPVRVVNKPNPVCRRQTKSILFYGKPLENDFIPVCFL